MIPRHLYTVKKPKKGQSKYRSPVEGGPVHWLDPSRKVEDADTATSCGLQLIRLSPSSPYYRSLYDGEPRPHVRRATSSILARRKVQCQKCRRAMVKAGILELTP